MNISNCLDFCCIAIPNSSSWTYKLQRSRFVCRKYTFWLFEDIIFLWVGSDTQHPTAGAFLFCFDRQKHFGQVNKYSLSCRCYYHRFYQYIQIILLQLYILRHSLYIVSKELYIFMCYSSPLAMNAYRIVNLYIFLKRTEHIFILDICHTKITGIILSFCCTLWCSVTRQTVLRSDS